MKTFLLITCVTFLFISCNNDDSSNGNESQNPPNTEVKMKLKEYRAINTSKYYYHENGFVDSISKTGAGMIQTNVSEKFFYDNKNNLQSIETIVKSYSNEIIKHSIASFVYNDLNQIRTVISQAVGSEEYISMNFNYNSEGRLLSSGRVYANENLIQEGNLFYNYDEKKNPFYEMYPLAYVRLRDIDKNNRTSTYTEAETISILNWTYNQNGYPISFQKVPVLPDDVDYVEYIYY